MLLVPGAHPPRNCGDRWVWMPREPVTGPTLWARVVTPTSGVRPPVYQPPHRPIASSPMTNVPDPSTDAPICNPSTGEGAHSGQMRTPVLFSHLSTTLVLVLATAVGAPPGATADGWRWPVSPPRIVAGYLAPAHAYAPGHRGIDLDAGSGEVTSPAAGTVAFVGTVAGRPLVTIDHGDGLVSTLEPVASVVAAGQVVSAGSIVGTVAAGGHAAGGTVHFGVRRDGEYINPLLLLGGLPRAVLLPCC